jgi:hypothetical protein
MDPTTSMLVIKSLDYGAYLDFSEYTGQWYVSSAINIGGDGMLTGITEHRTTPEQAIEAYLLRIQAVEAPRYIVTKSNSPDRRHYRWNGAAFAEVPSMKKEGK